MAVNGNRRRRLRNHIWFKTFGAVAEVPCHWCGRMLTFDEATIDHEPPLVLGGKWRQAVLACKPCNESRGRELHLWPLNERGVNATL